MDQHHFAFEIGQPNTPIVHSSKDCRWRTIQAGQRKSQATQQGNITPTQCCTSVPLDSLDENQCIPNRNAVYRTAANAYNMRFTCPAQP
jgi:hypothetical protein